MSWPPRRPEDLAASDKRLQFAAERLTELFAAADPARLQRATQLDSTQDIAAELGISVDELLHLVEDVDASAAVLAELYPSLRAEDR
jgi:hypothetical protein